jgi:hypothetical protein
MKPNAEGWRDAARDGARFAKWQALISYRRLIYQVCHTLQGKIGLVGFVLLFSMMALSTVGGFLDELPETTAGLDGFLLATHFWLALTLAMMVLIQFSKTFLKDRLRDPVVAHPALYPLLNRHRVLTAIPLAALVFTGLFYLYFVQLLAARLDHLWLAVPIHLLTIGLLVVGSTAIMGSLGRWLLRRATEGGVRNEEMLINMLGAAGIAMFCIVLLAIIIANERGRWIFDVLGNSIAVTIPIVMIPFAAALAADEGRWLALAGWLGLSAGFAFWAFRSVYCWSFAAHREFPIDLAAPLRRLFASVFTGRPGRWLPAGLSAFWRKDIVVPYSREPRRYLFHQVNLIWWGIMAAILAMALRNRGEISAAFANTIPVLITLFAMAVIAMQNGVNALGREGKELTWLRPILTGPQILSRKLGVNCAYVLVHAVVYALVIFFASSAATLQTSFWGLLAHALGAGTLFACLATTIGFLLPDFDRRGSSLPGSTAVGKAGYLTGALLLVAVTGTAHLLLVAGVFDLATYAGLLAFVCVCAAVGAGLLAAGAVRQYRGMEI